MEQRAAGRAALTASAVAFVVVPNVGALLGEGEQTDRYDTVITPPDYAFAVWAPIFVAVLADVAARFRTPEGHRESDTRTARPLTAAYAANTAWSLAAQLDRFDLTPVLLPTATGATTVAFARLQDVDAPRRSTVVATGLLLGWTALASTVNVAADAVRRGASARSTRAVAASSAGVLATGSALAVGVATSRRGAVPLALTPAWGLLTSAADPRRPIASRAVAGVAGGVLLGLSTLGRRRRSAT